MPRPRLRTDDELLDATRAALTTRGPADLTLADVAARAGVSPATLVQRFGTKRGLLLAFARRAAAAPELALERARSGRPGELRAALVGLATDLGDRRGVVNGLATLLGDLRDPELSRLARRHAEGTVAGLTLLVEAAIARGELAPSDPRALAESLWTAWNGAVIQWAVRGKGPLAVWVGAAVDAALAPHAIRTPPPARSRPRSPPTRR